MRIAMIGQKGLPATHGGIEHHVENLGRHLVALGHDVTVFTRPTYSDPALTDHLGMRLVGLPTIGTKHLDAIVHSFLCSLAVWRGGYDVVHYHAEGPSLVSPLARLRGRRVVATIHGQDWRRAKWGRVAASVLRLGEWMALHVPHATIVVSKTLTKSFSEKGNHRVHYIPNGVVVNPSDDMSYLEELGLIDSGYGLFVGRLVPEKGVHYLVQAWSELKLDRPLVVVGDTSHTDQYAKALKDVGANVIFTGFIYGTQLATIFRHAGLFILPSDLEGLPLVLLEATAYGVPVLVSDIAANREIVGDDGAFFHAGDVADLKTQLVALWPQLDDLKQIARDRRASAIEEYDWNRIALETQRVYEGVL